MERPQGPAATATFPWLPIRSHGGARAASGAAGSRRGPVGGVQREPVTNAAGGYRKDTGVPKAGPAGGAALVSTGREESEGSPRSAGGHGRSHLAAEESQSAGGLL